MPRAFKLVLPLLLLVALVVGGWAWTMNRRTGATPEALQVSGTIETTTADVGFVEGGRVLARPVDEGQTVHKGQLLATLDTATLQDQLAARQADVAMAQASLADAQAGARPKEIDAADAALAQAQALAADAADRYERNERLYREGAVSAQDHEAARQADVAAQAAVNGAAARLKLLQEGSRPQQIAEARAREQQAEAALALTRTQLAQARVVAPMDGVVLAKHVEPGEVVAPGAPAVTIARLDDVYLRAYVPETDLGRVKLGQTVDVTSDTFPSKAYAGRVSFISDQAEFTPRTVETRQERVKLVYRVRIDVANPRFELKPGMPADATIRLGP
ncbi:MAG TPA: efflux RND transporter periplasmic adaptor subunit [Oscillatoriaceae cyanobacterium]